MARPPIPRIENGDVYAPAPSGRRSLLVLDARSARMVIGGQLVAPERFLAESARHYALRDRRQPSAESLSAT
jgi:hypothetical protein